MKKNTPFNSQTQLRESFVAKLKKANIKMNLIIKPLKRNVSLN